MESVPLRGRPKRPRGTWIPEGTRFGRLEVVSGPYMEFPRKGSVWFHFCLCECGTLRGYRNNNLLSGNTESCGCLRRELHTTHGGYQTRLYGIWKWMLSRCKNPNFPQYHDYGGRGIYVCDEWQSFDAFRNWSMANGYAEDLEIDRWPNNDGPYSADNCRWATRKQQTRNTRRNNNIAAFGETKCLADWAKDPRCKVSVGTIYGRLKKGWDPERSMSTPPDPRMQRSKRDRYP